MTTDDENAEIGPEPEVPPFDADEWGWIADACDFYLDSRRQIINERAAREPGFREATADLVTFGARIGRNARTIQHELRRGRQPDLAAMTRRVPESAA